MTGSDHRLSRQRHPAPAESAAWGRTECALRCQLSLSSLERLTPDRELESHRRRPQVRDIEVRRNFLSEMQRCVEIDFVPHSWATGK